MVTKWELIGKIKASIYRTQILKKLAEKEYMPKELEKETNIKFSHISRTLKELQDLELVVCKNPKLKKGRFYQLTKKGRDILKKL